MFCEVTVTAHGDSWVAENKRAVVEVFRKYRVHASAARAFEHAYGPAGPWAAFFARSKGFRRIRLFRNRTEPTTYVQIQVWESKAGWVAFLEEHKDEYAQLAKELRLLRMDQELLGYYEGAHEYQPPVDARA